MVSNLQQRHVPCFFFVFFYKFKDWLTLFESNNHLQTNNQQDSAAYRVQLHPLAEQTVSRSYICDVNSVSGEKLHESEFNICDENPVSGEKLHDFEVICPAKGRLSLL